MSRCEYGGCQRISDYKLTVKEPIVSAFCLRNYADSNEVKERNNTTSLFCCAYHIGNIIESNHLSNVKCVIEIIKSK